MTRISTYLKGEALQALVIRFAESVRSDGRPVMICFDGEFLIRRKPEHYLQDESVILGIYNPHSVGFDFERMVADILESMAERGCIVE